MSSTKEPTPYIPPFKEFAIGVCVRAGTILMRNYNDYLKYMAKKKKNKEVITESDIEVHKFVQYKIRQQFPDHSFISEEGKPLKKMSPYTWVVDPLDGTLNYSISNPFFATSLTLMKDDTPLIGVTYAPYNREMFVAEHGRAARLNERNIRVSDIDHLSESVMSYAYFHKDEESRKKSMKLLQIFEHRSRSMRHLGCTALELAFVACGRLEAVVISPPLRLWDIAAGIVLVESAGGTVTNFKGKPWKGLHEGLVASNGKIHNKILRIIKDQRIS